MCALVSTTIVLPLGSEAGWWFRREKGAVCPGFVAAASEAGIGRLSCIFHVLYFNSADVRRIINSPLCKLTILGIAVGSILYLYRRWLVTHQS